MKIGDKIKVKYQDVVVEEVDSKEKANYLVEHHGGMLI